MRKHISFDTPDAKAFLKAFRSLTDRHEAWHVWNDFITLEACSIAMNCERVDKARADQRMKWASASAERYDDRELDRIAELAEITAGALQKNPGQDFLGQLYMSLDFGDTWRGQFFTPWNIAYMMAMMTVGQEEDIIAQRGFASVLDLCCGAGCMLLASAAAYHAQFKERNYREDLLFVGQDLDRVVALMCYIQLSVLGCAGYVAIGNSITNPIGGTDLFPTIGGSGELWYTPMWYSPVRELRRRKGTTTLAAIHAQRETAGEN